MSQTSKTVKVGLIQMAMTNDAPENEAKAASMIRDAAGQGAQLVCLPELFRTPYFCQTEDHACFDLAEPIPGPSTEQFGELAKERSIDLIVPLFEKRAEGLYHNTIAIMDRNGELACKYRKMHIPDDPGFYEKFYFTPGDLGFQSVALDSLNAGPLICWDQWFPEAARLTALKGAQALFYPTAIGWLPEEKPAEGEAQHDAWKTIQRSHAIANGVFVVSVNRTGTEITGDSVIEFWGQSFVCDPFGNVLAEASADQEEVMVVELDLSLIEETRQIWPFLRDRRTDEYGKLSGRFDD